MLLPSQPLPSVPDDTARVARAAFRRGNPYVLLRDKLGAVFTDTDFADLYPKLGQPAYAPWRLALVTLMQFREGLSDRQAAEAVRLLSGPEARDTRKAIQAARRSMRAPSQRPKRQGAQQPMTSTQAQGGAAAQGGTRDGRPAAPGSG